MSWLIKSSVWQQQIHLMCFFHLNLNVGWRWSFVIPLPWQPEPNSVKIRAGWNYSLTSILSQVQVKVGGGMERVACKTQQRHVTVMCHMRTNTSNMHKNNLLTLCHHWGSDSENKLWDQQSVSQLLFSCFFLQSRIKLTKCLDTSVFWCGCFSVVWWEEERLSTAQGQTVNIRSNLGHVLELYT